MVEAQLWHPVAAAQELAAGPLAVSVCGADLVLWRDPAGSVAAFDDRCPHRGARLSLGRLQQGRLACPYHGWQFDATGRCRAVPAAPDWQPPASLGAVTHPLCEQHGLWWVQLQAGLPNPPALPPDDLTDGAARRLVCGPYDLQTSAPRVVENFLDTAHFAFVHPATLGDAGRAAVPAYQVEPDAEGRPGVPAYPAWQPRAAADAAQGAWVHYRYQVLGPYSAMLVKSTAPQRREAYALWTCPSGPQTCRVWFTLWTDADPALASDAALRAFQHDLFLQDRAVLESQRPRELPLDDRERHGPADRLSTAYRRYLRQLGITYGVCA